MSFARQLRRLHQAKDLSSQAQAIDDVIERIVRPALANMRKLAETSPGTARGYAEDLERTLRATAEMWAQRAAEWTVAADQVRDAGLEATRTTEAS